MVDEQNIIVGWQLSFLRQYRRGYPLSTCLKLAHIGMSKYLNARDTDAAFDARCTQIEEGTED
jgi:hypothetical protein